MAAVSQRQIGSLVFQDTRNNGHQFLHGYNFIRKHYSINIITLLKTIKQSISKCSSKNYYNILFPRNVSRKTIRPEVFWDILLRLDRPPTLNYIFPLVLDLLRIFYRMRMTTKERRENVSFRSRLNRLTIIIMAAAGAARTVA